MTYLASSTVPSRMYPAQLTTCVMRPWTACAVPKTPASVASSLVTSRSSTAAPAALSAPSLDALRAVTMTWCPRERASCAMASPKPEEAPVMRKTGVDGDDMVVVMMIVAVVVVFSWYEVRR